ncbi:Rxt3-domain-containing protein [Xylona heveae TC161]|uniref:Rxt3-domain-containing protein n=1 Tax=Xylona heveae (strain CBS 132557 / TC161) TaxID=1328760 RepID=A0A165A362_XYLHT|nr:Rxt3-domain-containing protein [Xylona heveae TC161]KZF19891.1 Rxt3-domain-containing protein [Xylona heveae TC161]
MSHPSDPPRRHSVGTSPPRFFAGPAHTPPPPPPPFSGGRYMPPPTSPQQQQPNNPPFNFPAPMSRGPPPPPPSFTSGRDLPAPMSTPSIHRPGSSMSISAMLGDAPAPAREPASQLSHHSPPFSTKSAPSPDIGSMPSRSSRHSDPASAEGLLRRPRSPEKFGSAGSEFSRPARSSSIGYSPAPFAGERISPNQDQRRYPSFSQPPTYGGSLKTSPHMPEQSMSGNGRPTEMHGPTSVISPLATPMAGPREGVVEVSRASDPSPRPMGPEYFRGPPAMFPGERERAVEEARAIEQRAAEDRAAFEARQEAERGAMWGMRMPPRHSFDEQQMTGPSTLNRPPGPGFQAYPPTTRSPFVAPSPPLRNQGLQPPGSSQPPHMAAPRTESSGAFEPESIDRGRPMPQSLTAFGGIFSPRPRIVEQQAQPQGPPPPPKPVEEPPPPTASSRNYLGVNSDVKKTGRVSPAPQAVQGAQGQVNGPGEPGIKSEFGRMFSGIGSGVGSVMTAGPGSSGSQTPFGQSPSKKDDAAAVTEGTPIPGVNEPEPPRPARNGSRAGGKRSRKAKEEAAAAAAANATAATTSTASAAAEQESIDGRATPGATTARGTKRPRPHTHHHHHHHNHPHHHHHHHHRHEDGSISPISAPGASQTFAATNGAKRSGSPLPSATADAAPLAQQQQHHHHHAPPPSHHHHHHHHAAPKSSTAGQTTTAPAAAATSTSPTRKPKLTVLNQAVINSISNLPRHHLGSTLYAPRVTVPSILASSEEAKFGYASTGRPLPRFEGKSNCTFTVRVPRYYLSREHREVVCRRRAVWGTGVYTDDSDPLAAAIHSGWVRGDWGDDVDVSMLDSGAEVSESKSGTSSSTVATTNGAFWTKPPSSGPAAPPEGCDLHITLLILPALEKYASCVGNGVRSRSWDDSHDGASFKIEGVTWVDEGVERGEERTGEARRKRLRALMNVGLAAAATGTRMRLKGKSPETGRIGAVAA